MSEKKILVAPVKPQKSKGLWIGLAAMPLGFIGPIREFIAHNPELQPVISGLLVWLVRIITRAPLTIMK